MFQANIDLQSKLCLITGMAGFIGSNFAKRLLSLDAGIHVVGIDSMNDYYDVRLKEARLNQIQALSSKSSFTFICGSIADKELKKKIFSEYKPDLVVNLAAQAGVRYSITNPDAYIESNIIGFYNILEAYSHVVVPWQETQVYDGNWDLLADNPIQARRLKEQDRPISEIVKNKLLRPWRDILGFYFTRIRHYEYTCDHYPW